MTDREALKKIASSFPEDQEYLEEIAETGTDEEVSGTLYECETKLTERR